MIVSDDDAEESVIKAVVGAVTVVVVVNAVAVLTAAAAAAAVVVSTADGAVAVTPVRFTVGQGAVCGAPMAVQQLLRNQTLLHLVPRKLHQMQTKPCAKLAADEGL